MKNWDAFATIFYFVTGYKVGDSSECTPVEGTLTDWYLYRVEKSKDWESIWEWNHE